MAQKKLQASKQASALDPIPSKGGYDSPARFRARNNPIDAKNYDFSNNRTHLTTPNNLIESIIHFMMCGLGGGLVVLHSAYMECGLFAALAVNLVLSLIVGYCVIILVSSGQKLYGRVLMPQLSYPDIMEAAVLLSPWRLIRKTARALRYTVEGTLMIHLYGSCCVLVIMIGRNLKELVTGDNTLSDTDDPPLKTVILGLMVPCIIICMVTNLKSFAPFALICNLYAISIILILLWYCLHDIKGSPLDRSPYKGIMGLVEFTSVCTFVLEPVSYALPVENNMAEPKKFNLVVFCAMPIYTVAMMTVGFFGYWQYGESSIAPITVHLPFSAFSTTMKVFLCIILYVIYAMCFYVAFDLEWFYLKRNHQVSNYWLWERLYRTLHVIVLTVISFSIPNVTRMMGILGALSTTPAVLIYPPFIELLVDWEYPGIGRYRWRIIKCVVMILLGFLLMIAGSYYNIYGLTLEWGRMSKTNAAQIFDNDGPDWRKGHPYYTDLNRTDIKYNLTYNLRDTKLDYKNSFIPFTSSRITLNNNSSGLLTFNRIPVMRYYNSSSFLPLNTSNILPENVIPNFNNTKYLINNYSTLLINNTNT